MRPRLHDFLGGCARQIGATSMRAGGTADHVHILLKLPNTMTVATAMQKLKANSSRWVHETFPASKAFAWQEGYAAFSVSVSHADNTIAYIERQEEHHRKHDFASEWNAFLKKHGIEVQPATNALTDSNALPSGEAGLNRQGVSSLGTQVPR